MKEFCAVCETDDTFDFCAMWEPETSTPLKLNVGYIASGVGVDLSREKAVALRDWLAKALAEE